MKGKVTEQQWYGLRKLLVERYCDFERIMDYEVPMGNVHSVGVERRKDAAEYGKEDFRIMLKRTSIDWGGMRR